MRPVRRLAYGKLTAGLALVDLRCTWQLRPSRGPLPAIPVDTAVAFQPRSGLVADIRQIEGLALSGRGAWCTR